MSAFVLVSGSLFRSPEERTSKNGRAFTSATLKSKDGESVQWWKVVAFSESAQSELMRLGEGDAVSVQGPLKAEIYEASSGEKRISLSVIADHVLALRQPPKPRSFSRHEDCPPAPEPGFNESYEAFR